MNNGLKLINESVTGSDIITSYVFSIGLDSLENFGTTEPTFLSAADVADTRTFGFIPIRAPIVATYNSFNMRRKLF